MHKNYILPPEVVKRLRYFQLITSVEPKSLKLTKIDSDIYSQFRESFADLKIDIVSEDVIKSADEKPVNLLSRSSLVSDSVHRCYAFQTAILAR